MNEVIIVCGPTASGKTNFAHKLAMKFGGEIINADSMQIYKQIPIITASPAKELRDQITYHLYNFCDVDNDFSVAKYINLASNKVKEVSSRNNLPIVVGGSGLYISMLVNGYNLIPDIDESIRLRSREEYKRLGNQLFFERLKKLDPEVSQTLKVSDSQRIIRAYEVIQQTGKSIAKFQKMDNYQPLVNFNFKIIFLLPERSFLYKTCNQRLKILFDSGGVEEVRSMYHNFPNIDTTALKALGVQEIIQYIKGEIDLKQATELAFTRTRRYAKRQITWFKHQIETDKVIKFSSAEQYLNILNNMDSYLI